MTKQCDKKMFELLVLAALKHEEISEGRVRELLGIKRDAIRDKQADRVGILDYSTQEEVWAEEGCIRLRMTEQNGCLLVEIIDTTAGWPGAVQATATITDWQTLRLMAVARQAVLGYHERHEDQSETAKAEGGG